MNERIRLFLLVLALLAVVGVGVWRASAPEPAVANHKLPAPANVRVTSAALHSITIAWDPATSNVAGWHVQHRLSSGSWPPGTDAIDVPLGTTSYTFTGLDRNETYDLRVQAVAVAGHMDSFFAYANNQNTANLGPNQPRNPSVSASIQTPGMWPDTLPVWQATLSWDEPWDNTVRGADKYQVRLGDTGTWTDATGGANARNHTFQNLPLGFGSVAYVRACATASPDVCGFAHADNVVITTMSPPGPVVGPIVVTGSRELYGHRNGPRNEVVHQFTYSVGGVEFNNRFHQGQWFDLEWSESGSEPWGGLISGGGLSSFGSASLPRNLQSVYVRVRGANQGGDGPWSEDPIEVSFLPYISSVSAEANLTTATLRWSVVGSDEVNKFQVSKDDGETWEDADITIDSSLDPDRIVSHTFTGLERFTDYTLRVRPCRVDGSCTYGPRAFVTTNGPDAKPGQLTNLEMGVNTCRVDFRWNITPPEVTSDAGRAEWFEFQWKLDAPDQDDPDGEETVGIEWTNLRPDKSDGTPGDNPKFRNTSGYWTVPAAWHKVEKQFGGRTIQVDKSRGRFHMRVRAVNGYGASDWVVTGEDNQINSCPTETTVSEVVVPVQPLPPQQQQSSNGGQSHTTSEPGPANVNTNGQGNEGESQTAQNQQNGETESETTATDTSEQNGETETVPAEQQQSGQSETTTETTEQQVQTQPAQQKQQAQPAQTQPAQQQQSQQAQQVQTQPVQQQQSQQVQPVQTTVQTQPVQQQQAPAPTPQAAQSQQVPEPTPEATQPPAKAIVSTLTVTAADASAGTVSLAWPEMPGATQYIVGAVYARDGFPVVPGSVTQIGNPSIREWTMHGLAAGESYLLAVLGLDSEAGGVPQFFIMPYTLR